MSGDVRFEELDWARTPWGELSLRRRVDPVTRRLVHEVKLDDDFLMSSQFTASERELARLGVEAVEGEALRVLVGGLGLGYTAMTALEDPRVAELVVVEALGQVVDWHRRDLFPDTLGLAADPRVSLVHDDFFALTRSGGLPGPFDCILVDIDHSPEHLLRADHRDLYSAGGLQPVVDAIVPDGSFALWSDDPPQAEVVDLMLSGFAEADAHVVAFDNPLTRGVSRCTVYLARGPRHR